MTFDLTGALGEAWAKVMGWLESVIAHLPDILGALVVVLVFTYLAKWVRRAVRRLLGRVSSNEQVNGVLAVVVYAAVLFAGLFIALGVLGLDKTVTSLLAGAGIAGLAVGLAFQNTAENVISGIGLSVREQFGNGDVVEVDGHFGIVEEVNLRTTQLRTPAGQRVTIPNGNVYRTAVINYTQLGQRRVELGVGVSYDDDLEHAKAVAVGAVESVEGRNRDRPVELFYEAFGDSSIDFVIRFWVPFRRQSDYLSARSDAVMRIKAAFDDEGITIPFPITTIQRG